MIHPTSSRRPKFILASMIAVAAVSTVGAADGTFLAGGSADYYSPLNYLDPSAPLQWGTGSIAGGVDSALQANTFELGQNIAIQLQRDLVLGNLVLSDAVTYTGYDAGNFVGLGHSNGWDRVTFDVSSGTPLIFTNSGVATDGINTGTRGSEGILLSLNEIRAQILGDDGLQIMSTATGGGGLLISGGAPNLYSGQTTIGGGAYVRLNKTQSLGTLGSGNETIVQSGGTLDINGQTLGLEELRIEGTGVKGLGALVNLGGSNQNALRKLVLTGDATVGGTGRIDVRSLQGGTGETLDLAGHTLTKKGLNQLAIVGVPITDGNIVIDEGNFSIESTTAIGAGSNITVNRNAVLGLWNNSDNAQKAAVTVNAGGTVAEMGSGSSTSTFSAPITFTGDGNLRIEGNNNTTRLNLNGGIGGAGAITMGNTAGTRRFVISGNNTHTGTIYLQAANGGTLQLNAGTTLNSSNIYLQDGAQLDVSPIVGGYNVPSGQRILGGRTTPGVDVNGGLNLQAGAFLNAGGNNQSKTLTVQGPLNLAGGSTVELAVGAESIAVGGANTFNVPAGEVVFFQPQVAAGSSSIPAGTHALITAGAAPGAVGANFELAGGDTNYRQTFTFGVTGNNLAVTVAGAAGSATYAGTAAVPQWNVNSSANWTVSGGADVFKQLDSVAFDDTAANTAVNIGEPVNPGAIVVSSNTNDYVFSNSGLGRITGGASLTKSGSSTLTINGVHDFGGAVNINGGAVSVDTIKRAGLASSLGSGSNLNLGGGVLTYTGATDFTDRAVGLSGTGSVIEITNANAEFTFNNVFSGSGGFAKAGAGALKLTAANTYSGKTIISGGTVTIENSAAFGSVGAGNETIVESGATLDIGGRAAANTVNLGGEILQVSGPGVGGKGAIVNNGLNSQTSAIANLTLMGNTTVGGNQRWDIRGTGATFDAGGFKLTKVGSNEIALVGVTTSNIGEIEVNEGLFRIESTTNLAGDASKAIRVNEGGLFEFYGSNLTHTKRIELNGGELRTNGGGAATTVLAAGQVVALSADGLINVGGGSGTPGGGRSDVHLNILSQVTGNGDVIKLGPSSLRLGNTNNDWAGDLRIVQGFVDALDSDEVIPNTSKLILGHAGGVNLSLASVVPTASTARLETVAALETISLHDYGARVIASTNNLQNTLRVLTSGTSNYAGQLSRSGTNSSLTIEMAGTGEQILGGTLDNGGLGSIVTSGTLTFAKASSYAAHAIGVSSTINGGTMKLAGTGDDQIFRDAVITINGGALDLNGRSEGIAVLAGATGAGQVINSSPNASTLFVGDSDAASATFGGTFAAGAGAVNLVKIGNGAQTLNGATTYASTAPIEVRGGTLNVDLSNVTGGNNLLNPGSSLIIGGATFAVTGKATDVTSQTVADTTVNGAATVSVVSNGNPTSVQLGAIERSGTVNFVTSGTGAAIIQTPTGSASSVLTVGGVAFATFNGGDWAAKDAGNTEVVAFSGYTNDTWQSGNHTNVTTSATQTGATTDTLRFNTAGAITLTLDGSNALTNGGILIGSTVGANTTAFGGTGTLTSLANEVVIHQNNTAGGLTLNSSIVDNGNTPLNVTKSGGGTLSFNGNQAFTGALRILGGTVNQNGSERLASEVDLVMGNGGVYTLNNNVQTVASLSSNEYNASTGAARNGTINLGAGQLVVGGDNTSTTVSSKLSGQSPGLGTIVKVGSGSLTMSGADDNNSMNLLVREGEVTLGKIGGSRIANVSGIAPGAKVTLSGQNNDQIYGGGRGFGITMAGGTLDMNGRAETVGTLYGSGTITNTLGNTLSRLTVGEANNSGYFTGVITEAPGAVTSLSKTGSGILFLTGNHTFTGSLQIDNGRVAVPTIGNAGVASPVGGGTGGAVNVVLNGGTLTYTGSESITTDRSFDVRANNGSIEVLDPSANLTLTGQITGGDVRLNKRGAGTLTIRDSYTNQWNGGSANLVIQGGTLVLDGADFLGNNRSDLNNTGLFHSGMGLGLEGGNVIVKSKPGLQPMWQTFGRTPIANGWTTLTGDSSPGTGALTIELNALGLANAGSALNLVKPVTGNIRYNNNNENGITSPRVTFGGTTWAVAGTNNANNNAVGLATFAADNYSTVTNHVNVTADAAFAAAAQVATLRFNQAIAGGALGLDTQTLTLHNGASNLSGILVTGNVGANNLVINDGSLQGTATTTEIIVHQLNTAGSFEIGAVIKDNTVSLGLTKAGNGKLILSGANTFTGNLRVGGGVVEVATIGNKVDAQPLGKGDLAIQGGTIRYTGPSASTDKLINLHSAGAILDVANSGTTLTLTNNAWGVDGANHMGNVTKTGLGTLEITGNAATYTGFTTVDQGVLNLNPTTSGAPINPNSSGLIVNGGATLRFGRTDVFGNHQALTQPPVYVKAGGTVTNNSNNFNNLGLVVLSGGTLTSNGGGNSTYPAWGLRGQVTVDGEVTSTITGSGSNNGLFVYNTHFNIGDGAADVDLSVSAPLMDGRDSGGAARPTGFIKDGGGMMELVAGVNHTLTGFIDVVKGTMSVNGTLSGASTVNVLGTGVLTGSGLIGNLVLDGGTVSPGTSPAILGAGNTTFESGTFAAELNGSEAGTGYDQLNVTGSVKFTGATALTLSLGFAPALNSAFTLVNNDGTDAILGSGYFTYSGTPLADGAQFGGDLLGADFQFRIDYDGGIAGDGNDVVLTVVPEPTSAVLLLGGLGSMLAMRRRRKNSLG